MQQDEGDLPSTDSPHQGGTTACTGLSGANLAKKHYMLAMLLLLNLLHYSCFIHHKIHKIPRTTGGKRSKKKHVIITLKNNF